MAKLEEISLDPCASRAIPTFSLDGRARSKAVFLRADYALPFLTATEYPRIKAGVDQFAASLLSRDLQARLLQHQAAREARWEQQGARPHAQRALSRACTAARLHTCMCKAQHAVP